MPPIIGYSAAGGGLTPSAVALFGILFLWQFPHFYSIAWVYREDYAGAGIRMLPVIKSDGHSTAVRIVACSISLLFVSLTPHFLGMAGAAYVALATLLGLALTYFGVRVATERTTVAARQLLLASVLYLPALLTIMIVDSR